jgi:hypothetical protein
MGYKAPVKADIRPLAGAICSKGWRSFSVGDAEATKSKTSGNDMMVLKYICDCGEDVGAEIIERVAFSDDNEFGDRKARTIADALDYDWDENAESFEAWVADWLQYPALRLDILVSHEYTLKGGAEAKPTYKNDVSKEDFDNYDGKKYTKAVPKQYRVVSNDAEIDVNLHLTVEDEDGTRVTDKPPF